MCVCVCQGADPNKISELHQIYYLFSNIYTKCYRLQHQIHVRNAPAYILHRQAPIFYNLFELFQGGDDWDLLRPVIRDFAEYILATFKTLETNAPQQPPSSESDMLLDWNDWESRAATGAMYGANIQRLRPKYTKLHEGMHPS